MTPDFNGITQKQTIKPCKYGRRILKTQPDPFSDYRKKIYIYLIFFFLSILFFNILKLTEYPFSGLINKVIIFIVSIYFLPSTLIFSILDIGIIISNEFSRQLIIVFTSSVINYLLLLLFYKIKFHKRSIKYESTSNEPNEDVQSRK